MKKLKADLIIAVAGTQRNEKSDIFKTRKGYKNVQVDIIKGVAIPPEDLPHIKGTAYCWPDEGDKKKEYYIMEVPEEQAIPINRDFERRKGEYRREHRHYIWNKKHTKLIMCPFTNTCKNCPFRDKPDEIFPCFAEAMAPLSYDKVNEDKLEAGPEVFGTIENIEYGLEEDEMMKAIRQNEGEKVFQFVKLLREGTEYQEIMELIHIDMAQVKSFTHIYRDYKEKYLE